VYTLAPSVGLSADQLTGFAEDGYLVLPGFLPPDLVARVKAETDRWVDGGLRARSIASCLDPEAAGLPPLVEVEMPAHGELVAHPPLLHIINTLLQDEFVFHHMHSDRQAPDLPGKTWHHDYEQNPQTDRAFGMIHTLHYLDGLDPESAALVVLPGSHREVAAKSALAGFGTDPLAGEVVLERLPTGSTVVVHSALFHARRARATGKHRYFVDASYCQVGTAWPPVKPYWRHVLRRGRDLGLDEGWPELFAERHFTEYVFGRGR
jgi:hypothetical protein